MLTCTIYREGDFITGQIVAAFCGNGRTEIVRGFADKSAAMAEAHKRGATIIPNA